MTRGRPRKTVGDEIARLEADLQIARKRYAEMGDAKEREIAKLRSDNAAWKSMAESHTGSFANLAVLIASLAAEISNLRNANMFGPALNQSGELQMTELDHRCPVCAEPMKRFARPVDPLDDLSLSLSPSAYTYRCAHCRGIAATPSNSAPRPSAAIDDGKSYVDASDFGARSPAGRAPLSNKAFAAVSA